MSTTARISIEEKNGDRKSIYLHWDGYVERAGVILQLAYNTADKVRELISLGNLSILGCRINPSSSSHSFDTPEDNVCVAYHRDRGEDLEFWDSEQDFNYLFDVKDRCWYIEDCDKSTVASREIELFDFKCKYLLLDEIMELEDGIHRYWSNRYWSTGVIEDCIEKAKEAILN